MRTSLAEPDAPVIRQSVLSAFVPALACAAVLIPEAIAYAGIAGVDVSRGLLSALAGLLAYGWIGGSRYALVAPTSSTAAIIGAFLLGASPQALLPVVALTGLLLGAAWALDAGFLGALISRPVLRGFAWALAIMISLAQLPHLIGVHVTATKPIEQIGQLLVAARPQNLAVVACGLLSLAGWWLLHWLPRRPAWLQPSLVVLVVVAVLASPLHFDALGIPLLSRIQWTLPVLALPSLSGQAWLQVIQIAPAIALVLFAESWGTARSLALSDGEGLNARRELLALGVANLGSALVHGLPVGAGFSAANVNRDAGGRSRAVAIIAALCMILCLLLLPKFLALLPWPTLAAVIIGILSTHWWPRELIANARDGGDGWLGFGTAGCVLMFGTTFGMLAAIGFSLFLAFRRFTQPKLVVLGQAPGSTDFINQANHEDAECIPGTLILRPDEPLFFANADTLLSRANALIAQASPRHVILSLEMSDSLDSTALEALRDFIKPLQARGVDVSLARAKDPVRAAVARLMQPPPPMYWSVMDAVQALPTAPSGRDAGADGGKGRPGAPP